MSDTRKKLLIWPATLVGFALVLAVLFSQIGQLLARLLNELIFARMLGIPSPSWASPLWGLFQLLLTFLPPCLFLLYAGRPFGAKLSFKKGKIPFILLLPMFLFASFGINLLASWLQTSVRSILNLPVAGGQALPAGPLAQVLFFLTSCVAAAILEELFFRGAIQCLLRVWGRTFAILVTSVLFTFMHSRLWELPVVFLVSLMLGYVAEASGSLRACVGLHFANNTVAFLLRMVQEQNGGTLSMMTIFLIMLLLFALALAAFLFAKRKKMIARFCAEAPPSTPGLGKRLLVLLKVPGFAIGAIVVIVGFVVRSVF